MSPGIVHTPEGYKLHRERVQRNERVRAAGMDLYRSPFKNNEDFLNELDALIRKHEGERPRTSSRSPWRPTTSKVSSR